MESAICLVLFRDTLEDNSLPHFGILFENDWVLCLCCGSWLEPEDYRIIRRFDGFQYVDDALKETFDVWKGV